ELGVAGAVVHEYLSDEAADLALEPVLHRAAEEPDLAAVELEVRNHTSPSGAQDTLRRAVAELQRGRHLRTQLDEAMVKIRHPDLERVRHRSPVEVVQHVVDEAELRIEEKRALDAAAFRVAEPKRDGVRERVAGARLEAGTRGARSDGFGPLGARDKT